MISKRGFGSLDPERHKEISSKGGKATGRENRTFYRDRTLASSAGVKGGKAGLGSRKYRTRAMQADEE